MQPNDALGDIHAFCEQALADWNVPGMGLAIVQDGQVIWSRGYGYRDHGAQLPFTPHTRFPIASNTKLFTAVVAGKLVEQGLLDWDRPLREAVPTLRFSTDALNNTVSLRDMLAHRTGINRHDSMWFRSDFSRKDMFERLRHMQPSDPLRQNFVYNNVMYAAVGHIIELLSGQSWEALVQQQLLDPVGMTSACFSMPEVYRSDDHAVPYTERRDSTQLFRLPTYEHMLGAGPAGGLNANLNDMARWLLTLMNEGQCEGRQVISPAILKATMAPAMALPNHMLNGRGFDELLNCTYGMGRHTGVYRGHLMTYHGGSLGGFYSQVAYLPQQRLGVVSFVIGHHCAVLSDLLGYYAFERLLGLSATPWSARFLDILGKYKVAMTAARAKASLDHVQGTQPAHLLPAYAGWFAHPLYPRLRIAHQASGLSLAFRASVLPLAHVHYERFDTPDDEVYGKWSVNFGTDPQGEVDALTMTLDEAEVVFKRCPDPVDPAFAVAAVGSYVTPSGFKCHVVQREGGQLFLQVPGELDRPLQPYRPQEFRSPAASNTVYRFEMADGVVTGLKLKYPSGESGLVKL